MFSSYNIIYMYSCPHLYKVFELVSTAGLFFLDNFRLKFFRKENNLFTGRFHKDGTHRGISIIFNKK